MLLAVFVLLSGAVLAQGTVKGVISDADTDEALLGATAAIEGTTIGTTAGLDGSFEFSAPAGTHVLLIRFVGYEEISMNVTVMNGQVTDMGLIPVKSTSIGLDEVKVIAMVAGKPRLLFLRLNQKLLKKGLADVNFRRSLISHPVFMLHNKVVVMEMDV